MTTSKFRALVLYGITLILRNQLGVDKLSTKFTNEYIKHTEEQIKKLEER